MHEKALEEEFYSTSINNAIIMLGEKNRVGAYVIERVKNICNIYMFTPKGKILIYFLTIIYLVRNLLPM